MHQLELQLDESLAQRTEEIEERIQQESVDQEETLREAIAETDRLRAALRSQKNRKSRFPQCTYEEC